MLYCRRCGWSGMLERDYGALRCPDCKSKTIKNSRDPFISKRLKKNLKKPRKQIKKIKNMGLQILILEDTSRTKKRAFAKVNTTNYKNYSYKG